MTDRDACKVNLLAAFPYMKRPLIDALKASESDVRFLLDSGAFTAWKAGKPIRLDDYCRFIETLPITPWRYFTLDVIGNPAATLENYRIMLDRGFTPIPIFTRGEDVSVIDDFYKTSEVVGVGGLVGTRGNKAFINGIMKRIGRRKTHWLGFTNINYLKHYRPYMCDSTGWLGSLKFASLKLYVGGGKFVPLNKQSFITKPSAEVLRAFEEMEVDPALLAKSASWKNSGHGRDPIEWVAFRSFARYQIDVAANLGTKLFHAISSDWQGRLFVEASRFWKRKAK